MTTRKSRSTKPPLLPTFNPEHVDRIAQKMREGSSQTKDYAMVVYGSFLQSVRAKKSRTSALQRSIEDILEQDSDLTEVEVLARLRTVVGRGVIDAIDEETIDWIDDRGRPRTTNISALKDRVSRAKRKIRDSG